MLTYYQTARIEGCFKNRKSFPRFGVSAHEDIECRVLLFRPSMNTDVTFAENGHARDAAAIVECMQVNVQKGCPGCIHGIYQCSFNPITVVETLGVP